jgi:dihydrofolate synthase/folylpolyglutamate synthase
MAIGYHDAVQYLYSLQKHGIKLGLDNTKRLLYLLDNPQDSFRSVHIAGTNGKGSTSAMIASVLKTAGLRTGLFTSPHMVSFTERIRVNDEEIGEREVVELTMEIREVVTNAQGSDADAQHPFLPTFFEFVTAMGFLYFRRKGVQWAVIETGMGGRLDATNVLVPEVSLITRIGYDHREFLGETLKEIAGEKAGIIKQGIPVVCSAQGAEAMEVIRQKASERGSELFVYEKDFFSCLKRMDVQGNTFEYEGKVTLENLRVPLCGSHQVENAAVAVKALELISEKGGVPFHFVREGLARTQWKGRLELIRGEGCDFLIDGAHNPAASEALADALRQLFVPEYKGIILVLGVMADKDAEGIMKPLLPLASEIIFTAPDYERAARPERLAEYAATFGFRARVAESVPAAILLAKSMAGKGVGKPLAVITGSFYTIGEASMQLGRQCSSPSLARLR